MITLITITWFGNLCWKPRWRNRIATKTCGVPQPVNLPLLQPDARQPRDNGLTTNDPAAPVIGSHLVPISDAATCELTRKFEKMLKVTAKAASIVRIVLIWKPTVCTSLIKVIRHVSFVEYLSPLCLLSSGYTRSFFFL